jgi:hypothetical protein
MLEIMKKWSNIFPEHREVLNLRNCTIPMKSFTLQYPNE